MRIYAILPLVNSHWRSGMPPDIMQICKHDMEKIWKGMMGLSWESDDGTGRKLPHFLFKTKIFKDSERKKKP